MPPVYVADTNVYVLAANDSAFRQRFAAFIRDRGPLVVSAIVIAEVLIGIPDPGRHRAAVLALAAGTTPLSPTVEDWARAAGAVAQLGGAAITKSRSFWNDALMAAQCASLGAVLITGNTSDFRCLSRHLAVRTAPPFP